MNEIDQHHHRNGQQGDGKSIGKGIKGDIGRGAILAGALKVLPQRDHAPDNDDEQIARWIRRKADEFEMGKGFTIAPNVALDFVNGTQVWAFGVSFGYGF